MTVPVLRILALLALATALAVGPAAAEQPPKPVVVENLPAVQPVTVENLPAVQAVMDIDNPAAFPYQDNATDIREGTNVLFAEFDAVPEGRRLVIQDVAGRTVVLDPTDPLPTVARCELLVRDGARVIVRRDVPTGGPRENIPGARSQLEILSESVVAYAEPGQRPAVSCLLSGVPENLRLEAYLAGHYLPLD